MKRIFTVIVVLVIVAVIAALACAQFLVPNALRNYIKDRVTMATKASEVNLMLNAMPSAKMTLGYVDSVQCTAADATIGDLNLKQVAVDGATLKINIKEIVFPTEGISREEHTNRCLTSAGSLELSGVITEDALKNFLAEKVDRLQDPKVTMTPEGITASAKVKILGRDADVQIGGQIIARDGDLYFQMLHLNLENAVLRRVNLDRFMGDINITESVKMPFGLQFRTVEMRQGEAFVKATRN